jgi:hypothetical protein
MGTQGSEEPYETLRIRVGPGSELVVDSTIRGMVECGTESRPAVPPCPSGLLVVRLHAPGKLIVENLPHVGPVDPHAEGIRRHNHRKLVGHEPPLDLGSCPRSETGMIRMSREALSCELFPNRLHRPSGRCIDDRCSPAPT